MEQRADFCRRWKIALYTIERSHKSFRRREILIKTR